MLTDLLNTLALSTQHPLYHGLLVGFIIAAPFGPLSLLAIQTTVKKGWIYGVAIGFACASGDGLLAIFPAYGISWAQEYIVAHRLELMLLMSLLMLGIGFAMVFSSLKPTHPSHLKTTGKSAFLLAGSAFVVTLSQPNNMFAMAAGYALLTALQKQQSIAPAPAAMVLGTWFGALLAWGLLIYLATHLKRLNERWLQRLQLGTGYFIAAVGLAMTGYSLVALLRASL